MKELIEIQTSLKAPKNANNSFGGYKYRSAEDIIEALKPHLKKTKTAVLFESELFTFENQPYMKVTASLFSEAGKKIASASSIAGYVTNKKMTPAQETGATESYAKKYALGNLFAIDDTKDSDATHDGKASNTAQKKVPAAKPQSKPAGPPTMPPPEFITIPQLNKLFELSTYLDADTFKKSLPYVSKNTQKTTAEKIIKRLEEKIEAEEINETLCDSEKVDIIELLIKNCTIQVKRDLVEELLNDGFPTDTQADNIIYFLDK